MKTLKTIILSFACLAVTSCDFLDKEPTKLTPGVYFNNTGEAASFLTSVYAPLASQNFYGNEYMFMVCGDDLSHFGGGRNPQSSGAIACNNANSSSPQFSNLWQTLYTGIDRANTFLENIDKANGISDQLRLQYKSEARFMRAYYYFTLVQGWGDVPFKTSSTNSVTGLDIPRTDKQTIYDFIITEMAECTEGLSTAAELGYKPGHVSKSTAWGILARVYLFRAGEHFRDKTPVNETANKEYFKQASNYARKVMGQGHDLADNYWDVFIDLCSNKYNSTGKNESIWEVEFAGDYTSEVRSEGRIGNLIGIKCPDQSSDQSLIDKQDPGFGYAYFWSTPKLYELYVNNKDINRMNWNIAPFEYIAAVSGKGVTGRQFEYGKMAEVKKQYWDISYSYGIGNMAKKTGDYEKPEAESEKNYSRACGKYRREYELYGSKKNKNYTSLNFPLLRYSDVLLMVAEAENEVNNQPTTIAYQCLNKVRVRAGISTYPEGSLGKEAFRQAVKDERAMELCFEYTRRYDLIRWGEYVKNMNELSSRAQQGANANWATGPNYSVYTYFQITDAYNYFPIPDSEMSVNNAITQNNPGW
ncbi:RagB/SusD family nutrient uptake outer membrane protein [Bacteroides helcogenes]|uniref:RagB/SusD family nutrient uptake outer membrane protein n=1 Tax=Bacteroides helcogenes TaxID=290053 RepID=UPI002A916192|nr:RagB/SusD family nutrient uptake outer membrane protein [Bacteroides helcogenes]MDY5237634.1 RagB/SusD family nutrient uptake outer membrane protein [Bacteroides helcogenes]